MNRKARVRGGKRRLAVARLKASRKSVGKTRRKTMSASRKARGGIRKRAAGARSMKKTASAVSVKKIVRIMGQGQYTVDSRTLKKLNDLDNALVELVSNERSDDAEFRKKLEELNQVVLKGARPLDPKAIIQSDIILPSADLSIDEAKKLFRGEGVIPEF